MSSGPLLTTAKRNVETVAAIEQQLLGRHSAVERVGGGIARFFGSLWFIGAHALVIGGWLLLNLGVVPGPAPFDAYPFPFLGFVVAVEFIFLTTFVLMNQNLMSARQEQWAHLTLQVCMLAEQEVTKNMQMLHLISTRLGTDGLAGDQEVHDMARDTPLMALVEEIDKARDAGKTAAGDTGGVEEIGRPSPL
jgi:uncharacterized membrane protein